MKLPVIFAVIATATACSGGNLTERGTGGTWESETGGTTGSAGAGAGGAAGSGGTTGTAGVGGAAGGGGDSQCLRADGGISGTLGPGQAGSGAVNGGWAGNPGLGGSAARGGPGSAGNSGGDGGAAVSCGCPAGLAVEVHGDGAPLSLASADVSAISSDAYTSPQCLSAAPPWAEESFGGLSRLEAIQACAGPGAQPPCLFLIPWQSCNAASTYTDRNGRAIKGKVLVITDWTTSPGRTPLIEGDYEMLLEDGRTLTGHLRVCLIARVPVG